MLIPESFVLINKKSDFKLFSLVWNNCVYQIKQKEELDNHGLLVHTVGECTIIIEKDTIEIQKYITSAKIILK